ncbi:MAG: NAD-dependent epimerase/dehydratase family protein [Planctomycetes bacterium]|nr:NAD-dependent epimerase/dehydratase family protein [Planctomycetota bacterium]
MASILVTGGAGFIGSHLVDALLAAGHRVRVLDSLDPQVHPDGRPPEYLNPEAEYLRGDVRDGARLESALRGSEVVFHQASAVGVGQSQYRVHHYVDVNLSGTALLLDRLVNWTGPGERPRKLVVAASMSSYGEGLYRCAACGPVRPALRNEAQVEGGRWEPPCPRCGGALEAVPTPEEAACEPNSIYAITKRVQEEMVLLIGRTYGIPAVALRYFNVYGPRQSLSNPYTGVAAIFMSLLKNGRSPVVYEDGLQTRDFVHVRDVVHANLLAMDRPEADGKAFNVGGGRPRTIRGVAEDLAALLGVDRPPEVQHRFRKGDVRHCYADLERARSALGYEPRVGFREGMGELIEWSRTAEARDGFDRSLRELRERGLL